MSRDKIQGGPAAPVWLQGIGNDTDLSEGIPVKLYDANGNPLIRGANQGLKVDVVSPVTSANNIMVAIQEDWAPFVEVNESMNDSDKTFTVPASTQWLPLTVWVEFTSTGDAGDRQLTVLITRADDSVVAEVRAPIVQAASLLRKYLFAVGVTDLTSFRDTDFISTPLPVMDLSAGYKIRVYDNNAVQVGADDMIVRVTGRSRSI